MRDRRNEPASDTGRPTDGPGVDGASELTSAGSDPGQPEDTTANGPVGVTTTAAAIDRLLGRVSCPSPQVRAVAQAVAGLVDQTAFGSLGVAAQLADDVTVLARVTELLAAEMTRRVAAADRYDVTATGIRSTLAREGWSGKATWRAVNAGRFADQHPHLLDLWRAGHVNADTITTIASGVRPLPSKDTNEVVTWLLPLLPKLDDRQVAVAVAAAVDRLQPQDAEARQRRAYDGRYLTSSRFRDQVLIEARLPALEGEAFLATVAAFAEKLRSQDDGLTKGQRQADALAAMVAALAADAKTPSSHGMPAATTVVIPLNEAERIAAGQPREPQPLPDLDLFTNPGAAGGGTCTRTGTDAATCSCTGAGTTETGDPHCGVGAASGRCSCQADPGHLDCGDPDPDAGDDPWTTTDHHGCAARPFSCLPTTPGVIGQHHTLGDAAARFLLCASELTGVVVTTGNQAAMSPTEWLAALLGSAPLQPLAVGCGQRFATPAQRKALELRDGGCVIPGCGIEPRQCQAHHQPGWTQGGRTDLDQLALVCWPHHRQVDLGRSRLTRNPDPGGRHWLVQAVPRSQWRT